MTSPDLDSFLKSWVIHDKRFISYRLLLRHKQIHVADAKK